MVSTLFRPEPTTWLSNPEQAVHPAAAGGYVGPDGEELLAAQDILNRIHPHRGMEQQRNLVVVRACVTYANSLHNPAAAARGPWTPTVAPFTSYLSSIEPLVAHPFWAQLEVLASPLNIRHRRLPVATTADLLVRFRNGGDIGIGICQTAPSDQLNPVRVAAEAGAALALLGDTYTWWPRRAFTLFCSPGQTTVELVDVDKALACWIEALDSYRFMASSLQWERTLP
jgi:hypothetical protein